MEARAGDGMINKGRMPRSEFVDIKLRCGWIVRNTEPRLWRWKPWPEGESGGDITDYQPSREEK